MRIESEKLGELEIDESTVLEFPQGLLGFGDARRFALIDTHDTGVYFWLQSLDDPALAFLAAIPWPFFPDYEFDLPDADRDALGLQEPDDPAEVGDGNPMVLCLLTVDPSATQITANLLGPLVINTQTRIGRQVVLADYDFTTRAPLAV
ncbi:MAG TPA: flagellar assembly protein FliW, partial [Acidimicrobiales bacterium]